MKKLLIISVVLGLLSCAGSSNKNAESTESTESTEPTESTESTEPTESTESTEIITVPTNPKIELQATVKDENTVGFLIETNIPLPVEVMASIDLKNQKPDDTYIGVSKRIKIETSPYSYDLDISEEKLPNGDYEAVVTFYPRWGANNGNELAKEIESKVENVYSISLGSSSHGTAKERMEKDKKQLWIINNVVVDTPWDNDKFVKELGEFIELVVTNRNPEIIKAYYFSEADMTIFVSKPKKAVVTWREGKVDSL